VFRAIAAAAAGCCVLMIGLSADAHTKNLYAPFHYFFHIKAAVLIAQQLVAEMSDEI